MLRADAGWGRVEPYPFIAGHEICGIVTAAGSKVTNVRVGDRVGVGAMCGSCGSCVECKDGWQQHCRKGKVLTYGYKRPDGQLTMGGYADRIRCESTFAFRIPDVIASEHAAPLMCAGSTVYSPLARYTTRPNMSVGVIGVGGLGHLAIMFASKLQNSTTQVTAISHNSKKKDDAMRMGAKTFVDTSDRAQVKAAARTLDLIICTANAKGMDVR